MCTCSGMKRSFASFDLNDMEDSKAGVGMLVQKLALIEPLIKSEGPSSKRRRNSNRRAAVSSNPATAALESMGSFTSKPLKPLEIQPLSLFSAETFKGCKGGARLMPLVRPSKTVRSCLGDMQRQRVALSA